VDREGMTGDAEVREVVGEGKERGTTLI